jgi:D-alanyl-D-alanine carboxypeptidase/D-alanyl-D-alanine-endopeptidase (penicillin-binding protein 4)
MPVRLCLLLLCWALLHPARAQVTLPPLVERALAPAKLPSSSVAAVVQEVGAPRPVLSVNPTAPMNPASVMKLVTTYAALEQLGVAYRWKTEAYAAGSLQDDVLLGDLVLRGTGDPKLDLEGFGRLVRALRGKGLREIRGDLVLDRTRFAPAANGDAARFDGDPFRPYNVLPDALLVNYKSLRFVFVAEPERAAVRLYVEPRPPSLDVVNALRLADGPCVEGSAFRELLKAGYEPSRQRVVFSGSFPARCGEKDLNVALLEPNAHVAGVMRQFWSESGGAWTGAVREGPVPPGARLVHTLESPPLAEIVRDTNKFSNNIMARHLYLTLGAESAGAPADAPKALAAVKAWLAAKKIAAPELVMENGSGLSRIERVAAGNLAALLQAAWHSAVMPEFIASLPLAGVDGTMRRRLNGSGVAGQAHIKTGLLADVRAMGGYVLARNGRRYVVVMIVNHPRAHETQPAMDALLRWVYER